MSSKPTTKLFELVGKVPRTKYDGQGVPYFKSQSHLYAHLRENHPDIYLETPWLAVDQIAAFKHGWYWGRDNTIGGDREAFDRMHADGDPLAVKAATKLAIKLLLG